MSKRIADKTVLILIVEPQTTRRSMLIDGFKQLGFKSVRSAPSIKDALAFMENTDELPGWIVTPLMPDTAANGMHLLKLLLTRIELVDCRMSLILEPGQEYCLINAFELGLLSWHPKADDLMTQMAHISDLIAVGSSTDWNECLIAAHYLRQSLREGGNGGDWVRLEQALLGLFPTQDSLVVELAEALQLAGRKRTALLVLERAQGLSGKAAERARVLAERIAVEDMAETAAAAGLGLGSCVVIDPDEAMRNLVAEALKLLGVAEVHAFSEGGAALEHLAEHGEPDLLIQEWRLPHVPGNVLVQRVRTMGFARVPVVVFSSLVKSSDRMLLREMGVSDVIEKPKTGAKLAALLKAIVQEGANPANEKSLELTIRKTLRSGDFAAARRHLEKSESMPAFAETKRKALEAELAFLEGKLKAAGPLAVEALQSGGEDVLLLNLLGKIYMKMRQFTQATKFFERAQALSPDNVERLCELAEVKAESSDLVGAEASVAKAKKLSPEDEHVRATEAKLALVAGDRDKTRDLLGKLSRTSDVVAFLNNRAVSLVAEGKTQEAIELYQRALQSLPEALNGLIPPISYNLALAFVKDGNMAEAQRSLLPVLGSGLPVEIKARSLEIRLSQALLSGEPFVLRTGKSQQDSVLTEEIFDVPGGMPTSGHVKPGELCCHGIFHSSSRLDPRVEKLLLNGPRFHRRPQSPAKAG